MPGRKEGTSQQEEEAEDIDFPDANTADADASPGDADAGDGLPDVHPKEWSTPQYGALKSMGKHRYDPVGGGAGVGADHPDDIPDAVENGEYYVDWLVRQKRAGHPIF